MDLVSAKALKEELLSGLYGEALGDSRNLGLRVQGLGVREESEQAGIGFSRRSSSEDFQIEIRLRRPSGRASQLAKTIQSKSPQEVSVAVIQQLEIPAPETLAQSAYQNRDKARFAKLRRPLHLGLSVGHVNGGSGSIGAFVRANRYCKGFPKGGDAILSACHVLALQPNGTFVTDAPIYQPGRPDLDTITGEHQVATMVNHYTTFSRIGANYVDAAYAMINSTTASELLYGSPNQIPSEMDLPISGPIDHDVLSTDDLRYQHQLAKVGRTTGFTYGRVSGFEIDDIAIGVPGIGNIRFDNLLEIEWENADKPFAMDGDSGSLVFDPASKRPIGLHFAGGVIQRNGKQVGVSYACNLEYILTMFDLSLL